MTSAKNLRPKGARELIIALAQLSPIVGAIEDNLKMVIENCQSAKNNGADIIIFSEAILSGYPAEDLILKPSFVKACQKALEELVAYSKNLDLLIIIGSPCFENGQCYNSAFMIAQGAIIAKHHKVFLPNYGEFDEKRLFKAGSDFKSFYYKDHCFAIAVCEDIWQHQELGQNAKAQGAQMLFVINGSPYTRNKMAIRHKLVEQNAIKGEMPVFYVNQIGGQDSLVFDGASFVIDHMGQLCCQLAAFKTQLAYSHWYYDNNDKWLCKKAPIAVLHEDLAADYQAILLALRDYSYKNGFNRWLLGLSGGIDSALTLAIACDAFGPEKIDAVMLSSQFTSAASHKDAQLCAKLTGANYSTIDIENTKEAFLTALKPFFHSLAPDVTEENLQSRIRGCYLMALSNKFNSLLLTTGNKSEMAVGYATLYGDMNGGFNPIKDLYKTEIYQMAAWRNQNWLDNFLGPKGQVIADNIFVKAPSAELRAEQTDQDSLPPYDVLDAILYNLLEQDLDVKQIIAKGYSEKLILDIAKLVKRAEYKRYQAPPGPKLSSKSFNRDRRYPLTNHYIGTYP